MQEEKLILFMKAPAAGRVKTRLAEVMGPEGALGIYTHLVRTLVDRLRGWPGVEVRFSPDEAEAAAAPWVPPGWPLRAQGPGDLGARMQRAFTEAFREGFLRTVIIGSDCPFVTPADISEAFALLRTNDLVLGPAKDGGYWLVGLASARPFLFEKMPWSTPQVLEETVARAQAHGLRTALLRSLSDIDTPADWEAYVRTLPPEERPQFG